MIYLASKSPRRVALCQQIGLEVTVLSDCSVDETPIRGEIPRLYAERITKLKAESAAASLPEPKENDVLIAADTVLATGRRIFAKTDDVATATAHLQYLSGRNARVWGGLAVWFFVDGDWQKRNRISETRLKFARLSEVEIADYLALNQWRGCAGAIAIQGAAARFVDRLQGSYSNVVGMDVAQLWRLLPNFLRENHHG